MDDRESVMRVLVTGGAGYIGSFMVSGLVRKGFTPIVIDNLSNGNRHAVHGTVRFHEGDIGDKRLLDTVLRDEPIDMVMHFAAKISVEESLRNPNLYYENNVAKTLVLLDAMLRHGVGRIIFSSSAAVYGEPRYLPVDETHPLNPVNPYGKSKKMVENILLDFHKAYGLSCSILRFFNVAGASRDGQMGESQQVKQNLIPIVLNNLEGGRVTTIFGSDWDTSDGTCVRDYIHVEDIVTAYLLVAERLLKETLFEIINLGSGKGTTVQEVLNAVLIASGKAVPSKVSPRREGDVARLVSSTVKARELMEWIPIQSDIETIVSSASRWHFNRRY